VLPAGFPAGGPRLFELAEEWPQLKERYASLGPSETLDWVYTHMGNEKATHALLEHEYIDSDYRDEYANFYIKVFRNLPDRGERLHFWAEQRYLGYCSIRPVYGQPVCRTMLDPAIRERFRVQYRVRKPASFGASWSHRPAVLRRSFPSRQLRCPGASANVVLPSSDRSDASQAGHDDR
jgi:hypothetical protein